MATEVASGYVSLYARMDAAQVASEVAGALQSANIASAASTALESVGSGALKVGGVISAAGILAARQVGKMASSMMETVSGAENATIAFRSMTGSASDAASIMQRLNTFAIKTPYEFSNISAAAKQLMGNGFEFNQLLDSTGSGVLKWAGDMSAALGLTSSGYQNVLTQLGHMKSAGKVYTIQMTALARNGIPAWQALADYMGTSIDDVRSKVRKGQVDAETGMAALQAYAESHFNDTMDAMSHTLSGVISNFSDAMAVPVMGLSDTSGYRDLVSALYDMTDPLRELVQALMPTMDALMERLAPLAQAATAQIQNLTKSFQNADPSKLVSAMAALAGFLASGPLVAGFGSMSKSFGKFAGTVGKGMDGILGGFRASVPGMRKQWKSLADGMLSDATKAVHGIGGIFSQIDFDTGGRLSALAKDFKGKVRGIRLDMGLLGDAFAQTSVGTKLVSTIKALSGPLSKASKVAGGVGMALRGLNPAFSMLSKAARAAANVGVKAFVGFAKGAAGVGSVLGVAALAAAAAGTAFVAMGGDLGSLGQAVSTTLYDVGTLAGQALQGITDAMQRMIDGNQIQAFFDGIMSGIQGFAQQVGPQLQAAMQVFPQVFAQVVSGLSTMLVTYAPMVLSGAIQLFTGLISGLTTVIQTLTPMLPTFIQQVGAVLVANIPALVTAAVTLFSALVQGFAVALPEVLAQLQAMLPMLSATLIANMPTLLNAAAQLFEAIAQALPVVLPLVISGIAALLNALVQTFPQWGPRLMSATVQIMLGVIRGIAQMVPQAVQAIALLIRQMVAAFPAFVAAFFQCGVQLMMGLIRGIASMVGNLVGAIGSAISNGINAAKRALGIASPSKVFAEIGRYTMLGLANGITGSFDYVEHAMDSTVGTLGATVPLGVVTPVPTRGGGYGGTVINVNGASFNDTDVMDMRVRDVLWTLTREVA